MNRFDLGKTPDTSALILVRGEVQNNHVANFHKVMRYGGELAVVTTTELEEAMPLIGMHLIYRGVDAQRTEMLSHRRTCAEWVASYATERFGLEPFKYDVHLIDGAPDMPDAEGLDGLRQHWHAIPSHLTDRRPRGKNDGGFGIWRYEPFQLVDNRITGIEGETPEGTSEDKLQQLKDVKAAISASRHPVEATYAKATLLNVGKNGLLKAHVTFSYPTLAVFKRKVDRWGVNDYGDKIIATTEISNRTYEPVIPVELQIALDDANAAGYRATQAAIERHGDETLYEIDGRGITEYNNDALLAPIHNLI